MFQYFFSETNNISEAITIFRDITQSKFLKLHNHQKFSPHKPIEIHSPDWIYWEGPHQQIYIVPPLRLQ